MDNVVRNDLLRIYKAALIRVSGYDAVRRYLEQQPLRGKYRLVAIGKAAASMTLGALAASDEAIEAGLVITKHGHVDDELSKYSHVRCLESNHPVPGEESLAAGAALLEFIEQSPDDAQLPDWGYAPPTFQFWRARRQATSARRKFRHLSGRRRTRASGRSPFG